MQSSQGTVFMQGEETTHPATSGSVLQWDTALQHNSFDIGAVLAYAPLKGLRVTPLAALDEGGVEVAHAKVIQAGHVELYVGCDGADEGE